LQKVTHDAMYYDMLHCICMRENYNSGPTDICMKIEFLIPLESSFLRSTSLLQWSNWKMHGSYSKMAH